MIMVENYGKLNAKAEKIKQKPNLPLRSYIYNFLYLLYEYIPLEIAVIYFLKIPLFGFYDKRLDFQNLQFSTQYRDLFFQYVQS